VRRTSRILPGFVAAGLAIATLIGTMPAGAQDLKRPEEQLAAIYALKVQLDIEQKRLDAALRQHAENARTRDEARVLAGRLYDELDDMIAGRTEATEEALGTKEREVSRAEIELEDLSREGRRIRGEIRETRSRLDLLTDRIGRLRRSLPSDTEALTGSWDVTYVPSDDKGVFTLRQSGTIIAGEYALEGGWKGSLQGTVVDGKVHLTRIDTKLGRSQDLQGTVASDGRTIRGTWQNAILSGGEAVAGSWIARKRAERPDAGGN